MVTHYDNAVGVTKSDSTIYNPPLDGFYVGGTGDVAVRTISGTTLTLSGCAVGNIYPIRVDKIMSTNTTATLIIGLRIGNPS